MLEIYGFESYNLLKYIFCNQEEKNVHIFLVTLVYSRQLDFYRIIHLF